MCSMNVSNTNNNESNNNEYFKNGGYDRLEGFFDMLSKSGLSDNLSTYNKLVARYRTMHQDTPHHRYINMFVDVVTYYVSHGKHSDIDYESIWEWQYNSVYLRRDFNRVCHPNMVAVVDELISADYSIDHIRRVIRYMLMFDFTKSKIIVDDTPTYKPDYTRDGTTEYIEFLEVLSTTLDYDMLLASKTLCEIINYYFDMALTSVSCVPFSFMPDMYECIANNIPLYVALDKYFMPKAEGSVEDMGYLDLLTRSVKSTIDIPTQVHNTVASVAAATSTMSLCAERMNKLGDSMTAFIEAFMQRTTKFADSVSSEAMVSMIEIFIDFMSDLPDLKSVSCFRWTTYCSRVLRLFIPNCVGLAINLFNTYISALITTVAEGMDDLLQTILVVFSGAIALQGVPDRANVNKMMEYMKSINIAVPFSKNMVQVVHSMISMLPEAVKIWASQYIPEHVFYVKLTTQYALVIQRIDVFLTYDIDRIYFDKALGLELISLYSKAHDLVRDMAPFVRDVSGEFSLLREQLRKFDKLYESYQSIQKCGVIRVCPFSLTIYGRSQIGKSTLSAAIAKYMFPDCPADRVRYVIPTDPEEFWSGYSPLHRVTAEDDADQDAEYTNALQLFSIVTNAPYQPPMASVDDRSIGVKGTPYHSKMHIRCTNNPYPRPSAKILTVEAYWKRRHMLVEARVLPGYLDGNGKVLYSPVFKHLEFYLMDPVDDSAPPVLIGDLMSFLSLLRRNYDDHMLNEDRVVNMMTSDSSEYIESLHSSYATDPVFTDAQGRLVEFLNDMQMRSIVTASGTYECVRQYLENHPRISTVLKLCGVVASITTVALGMVSLYSVMFKQPFAESIPSGDHRTMKFRKIKRPAYSEGTTDPSAESLIMDVVRGRQCVCSLYDRRTGKMNQMSGLFIGGRYVVFPYHLFLASDGLLCENHSRMVLTTDQAVFEQMFEPKRLSRLSTKSGELKDCCVYECTLQVRAFKDIRHHFIDDGELTAVPNWCEATINKFTDFTFERQLINVNPVTMQKYLVNGSLEPYTLYKGYQYDAVTTNGDCGSVIVAYNTKIRGKLLGIHVAGDRNRHHGYAELITSSMLDNFVPRVQPQSRVDTCDDRPAIVLPEGNYTYFGSVPAHQAVYPVTKTEIKPSLIHGVITAPITSPVSMDKRDFPEVISRFFHTTQPINPIIKKALLEDAYDCVAGLDSFHLGVIDEFRAINGDLRFPYFERLNMSTSPGLPYKKMKSGKGKAAFFDKDENGNYTISDPHLRTMVDMRIAMAKNGQSCASMWMDIPKDERRKPGKKVRMIITPPLDYQIVFRMYFMDYIVAFYNSRLKNHSAVGINPYSLDWTELMDNLKKNSDVGGDGDHSHMDGDILNDLMEIEIDSINHYYKYEANHEESARVREVLWNELVHTPTQCMNVAYCVHCGNPSGCNCTTIINTNACDRYYKLAWLGLAPTELRSMKHFYDSVRVYAYGDDSITSIKREVLPWYNFKTISEHLKDLYNITFTMADKSGNILEFKDLDDCTFLKNGFRREGMIYHAIMDENTLHEMVNWIRDSDDDFAASVVNANMALMMWYHYGVERFSLERSRLLSALVDAGRGWGNVPHLLTWDYLDMCFVTDRNPIATEHVPLIEANQTIIENSSDLVVNKTKPTGIFASLFKKASALPESEGFRHYVRVDNMKWKKFDPDVMFVSLNDVRNYGQVVFQHVCVDDPDIISEKCEWLRTWDVVCDHLKADSEFALLSYANCKAYSINMALTMMRYAFMIEVEDIDDIFPDDKSSSFFTASAALGAIGAAIYAGYKCSSWMRNFLSHRGIYQDDNNLVYRGPPLTDVDLPVAQGKEDINNAGNTAGEVGDTNIKEETNYAGAVTFIEQTPAIEVDRSITPRDSENLMFGHWSVQRIFAKPQRIGTYAFTTTAQQGDNLKTIELPQVLWDVAVWRTLMQSFTFMKYRPVVRAQINGNKFAAGRLILYTIPYRFGGVGFYDPANKNIAGYTGFDHVFLDASSNDSVVLSAPWVVPYEWFNIAAGAPQSLQVANRYLHAVNSSYYFDRTNSFRLTVFNPLQVGTGAPTTIYVTLFLHLEDVSMCVPQVNSATSQGGTHSYVTNTITNWEKVASQTLPNNVTGDTFDLNADLKVSTMDCPSYTLSPMPLVRRAINYMSNSVNMAPLQRMALYPGHTSTSTPLDFGTKYDEMDISYLCGKYTYWYSGAISTNLASGSVITYLPITPYVVPTPNSGVPHLISSAADVWFPTGSRAPIPLISYVTMPFNFWGGSLKYRFDFITNHFVTMKIYCAIIYGTCCPETITAGIEPTSGLGYTFELNGDNKTFEVEVPFVSETPWKRVMRSQFASTTTAAVTNSNDDVVGHEACTGQIALYVLNPLSIPNGLPTSYQFNVFIAGGKDYRVNYLSRANTSWIPVAQGIDPNPGTDLSHLGQTIMATDLNCLTENYKSIKDVLKRYSHVRTVVTTVNGYGTDTANLYSVVDYVSVSELLMPFFTSQSSSLQNASNVLNWYLALYRFWRGSLRFKIMFEVFSESELAVDMAHFSVDYIPDMIEPAMAGYKYASMGVNDESIGPAGKITATEQMTYNTTHHGPRDIASRISPICEFEIPFVYPNRIVRVPGPGNDGYIAYNRSTVSGRLNTRLTETAHMGTIVLNYAKMPNAYRVVSRIFIAVGDDFRAGCQMGTPLIAYAGVTQVPSSATNVAVPPDFYS
jgi:hypothetical protein